MAQQSIKIKTKLAYQNKSNKYGDVYYSGKIDDKTKLPHGEGKRFYSNGDVLVGVWKEGRIENGCLTIQHDRRWVEGPFKNGLLDGECIEWEDGVEHFRGKYTMGSRELPKGSRESPDKVPPPTEQYIVKLRKNLFDQWLLQLHRYEKTAEIELVECSQDIATSRNKEEKPLYLYTYLSSMEMLGMQPPQKNQYIEDTQLFITKSLRFEKFYDCLFSFEDMIIRFNCELKSKEPVIYCFGTDEAKMRRNWLAFKMLYRKETKSDPKVQEHKKEYQVMQVHISEKQQRRPFNGIAEKKLAVCYLLKRIVFENFHSIPLPKQLDITVDQLEEFKEELYNAVLYNRCCLQLTNEDELWKQQQEKEKKQHHQV